MSVQNQLRWGGLVAMVAALLMIVAAGLRGFGVAPLAGQWAIFVYVILLTFAFTALYAAQAPRMGRLGFAGYVLAILGLGLTQVIAFLILASFTGLAAAHEVQMFAWGPIPILHLAVLANTLGGILFGAATVRAGLFPRWTGLLLIAGEGANLLHEYLLLLPVLMIVPAALMAGAFAGLGWSLWAGAPKRAARPLLAS